MRKPVRSSTLAVMASSPASSISVVRPQEEQKGPEDRRPPDRDTLPAGVAHEVGRREVTVALVDQDRDGLSRSRKALPGSAERSGQRRRWTHWPPDDTQSHQTCPMAGAGDARTPRVGRARANARTPRVGRAFLAIHPWCGCQDRFDASRQEGSLPHGAISSPATFTPGWKYLGKPSAGAPHLAYHSYRG